MKNLVAKAQAWYGALQERERRIVAVGGIALAVILLIGGVILPLRAAVSSAVQRADARREDLAWMRINAPEIQASGGSIMRATAEPPMVVVDRVGRESGLGSYLRGTQPSGSGVRVQVEGAPFDKLISWVATLDQRYGLAIESITVDRAAKPGVVNANVTFAAPHP
jgi:general secretion pathway protein M